MASSVICAAAAAQQPPLSDLRTLVAGFHDLSVNASRPAPAPAPVVAAAPVNLPPKIYTGEEPGVRAPQTIAQDMPGFPGLVPPTGLKGVVEIVINETGAVESAAIIVPVTSAYDKAVLTAASRWQFLPAMAQGAAVKFRKRININVSPPVR